jgi:hypothetical protein
MKVNEIFGLNEAGPVDQSELDDTTYDAIKHELDVLSKEEEREFPTALALVHAAYEATDVERPTPAMRGGWIQYETLITLAVQILAKNRPDGNWRLTTATSKAK